VIVRAYTNKNAPPSVIFARRFRLPADGWDAATHIEKDRIPPGRMFVTVTREDSDNTTSLVRGDGN
jgi:hypothetical protein